MDMYMYLSFLRACRGLERVSGEHGAGDDHRGRFQRVRGRHREGPGARSRCQSRAAVGLEGGWALSLSL